MDNSDLDNPDFDAFDFESSEFDNAEFGTAELGDVDLGTEGLEGADLGISEFGNADLSNAELNGLDLGKSEFETSRIETYDATTTDFEVSQSQMSEPNSALELNETEEIADTVAFAQPENVENPSQVDRASRKRRRKKSGSLTKTMDRLVILAALGLFCLWLLGHGLLSLIGGSSGSTSLAQNSLSGGSGAAVAQLDSEVAEVALAEKEKPASEMSESGSDSDSELVVNTNAEAKSTDDGLGNVLAVADRDSQADIQGQGQSWEPAETPIAPPIETSFRPTYTPVEPAAEGGSFASSSTGDAGGSNWERKKPGVEADQGAAGQPDVLDSDTLAFDDSEEFGGDDAELGVEEAEMGLGSDAGPIGKLTVEPETAAASDASMTEIAVDPPTQPVVQPSESQFAFPKSYAMRVWTSSRGSKAKLALVRVEGGDVVVVDEKGTEFSLPFARFSEEDQAYVRDAIRN